LRGAAGNRGIRAPLMTVRRPAEKQVKERREKGGNREPRMEGSWEVPIHGAACELVPTDSAREEDCGEMRRCCASHDGAEEKISWRNQIPPRPNQSVPPAAWLEEARTGRVTKRLRQQKGGT